MWIGLLPPGTHVCRPIATPGMATVFAWDRRHRMRLDTPVDDVADAVAVLRDALRRRRARSCPPRCFDCATPYLLPDPDDLRAMAEEVLPPRDGDRPVVDPADPRAAPCFVVVHLDDRDPDDALVLVPTLQLALRTELTAVGRLAELLGPLAATAGPALTCDGCGAVAPAGAVERFDPLAA